MQENEAPRVRAMDLPVQIITFAKFGTPLVQLVKQIGKSADTSLPPTQDPLPPSSGFDLKNAPFNVPFPAKGDQLVGQIGVVDKVRETLVSGRRTSIGQAVSFQGLGGLGKTQLAVEYAWTYKDQYPNGVIWLTADVDIDAQLVKLADDAEWVYPNTEHKIKLDMALNRLRSYPECLIIFDNLEDQNAIERYLPPPTLNAHILITSRTEQRSFIRIPIDVLDEELSLQLLLQVSGRPMPEGEELAAAQDIARELGGLPLALEIAGAYLCRRDSVSWNQYREMLRSNMPKALDGKLFDGFTKHSADLYSTLRIDEELLSEATWLREIIDVLTWSAASDMGISLFCCLLDVQEYELVDALGLGVTLRILQKSENGERYSLHRLVREVRQFDKPLAGREEWIQTICERLGDWFEERREDFANLVEYEAERDHLVAWERRVEGLNYDHAARLTWLQAYPPYSRGQYHDAHRLVIDSINLFNQGPKTDRVRKAHLLNDAGATYHAIGDFQRAREQRDQALAIRREMLGERHHDTATSLCNLAVLYQALGEYAQAKELYEQALAIRREVLGERHHDTATSLSNLAGVYRDLGEYTQAKELFEQALAIRRKVLSERHPDTASSLSNLAGVYQALGEYAQAKELHEQVLAIRREVLGERHPDTASSLSNLAVAYRAIGEYAQAKELHEQALVIRREVLGERHPDTAMSLNNLAMVYHGLGEFAQALKLLQEDFEICREYLGDQHPATIITVCNIAGTLWRMNRHKEAYPLVEQYLRLLPKDHLKYRNLMAARQEILNHWPDGFRKPGAHGVQKPQRKKKSR